VVVALIGALLAGAGWVWWQGSLLSVPVRPHCSAVALERTTELDPEQAGNAATIAGIAVRRGLPARAATIGIATAIQESKLRNIDYGDRDSLGLFQQRPSQGWGTAAQVQDPVYATNAFYDVLVKVEGYQNLPITKAAQQVQRSAFPAAYADHEPEARIMASALTGHSPESLTCVLRGVADLPAQQPGRDGVTARAQAVLTAASTELGRSGSKATGESGGTVLSFAPSEGSSKGETDAARREAWALAQWAVARAQGLHIVAVEVDGRQWRRSRPDQGWTALPADARRGRATSGEVVVQVA